MARINELEKENAELKEYIKKLEKLLGIEPIAGLPSQDSILNNIEIPQDKPKQDIFKIEPEKEDHDNISGSLYSSNISNDTISADYLDITELEKMQKWSTIII